VRMLSMFFWIPRLPSQTLSLLDHWLRESIASPRVDFFVDDLNKIVLS